MYFDTHAHLDDERFDGDRDEVIASLESNRVSLILNASSDMKSSHATAELCARYPFIYGAVGVHPHSAEEMRDSDFETLTKLSALHKIKAIGEIGLDYYYDLSPREVQKKRFYEQLLLARELKLPVIIHDRDAHGDCLEILRNFTDLKVVYHCYSGSVEYAEILLKLGFYLSFTGSITFKNAKTAPEVIHRMPRDRFMIETDSPYLTPVPLRGKRNSPAYVPLVALRIAEILNITQEEAANISMENGKRFFDIE